MITNKVQISQGKAHRRSIRQVDVLIELEDERSEGNLYPGKRTPNNIEDDGEDFDFRIMKEAFPEYIR